MWTIFCRLEVCLLLANPSVVSYCASDSQAESNWACLETSDQEADGSIPHRHFARWILLSIAAVSSAKTAGAEGAGGLQASTRAAWWVLGWHSVLWLHSHLSPCHVRPTRSPATRRTRKPGIEACTTHKWTCADGGTAPTQASPEAGWHGGLQQMHRAGMPALLPTPTNKPNCMPDLQTLSHPDAPRWVLSNLPPDEVTQPTSTRWTHAHQTGPESRTMLSLFNLSVQQD